MAKDYDGVLPGLDALFKGNKVRDAMPHSSSQIHSYMLIVWMIA